MYPSSTNNTSKRRNAGDDPAVRPTKRLKSESEVNSRKQFLNGLRALCDRWAVHVQVGSSVGVDGKELLRHFLRETLPPKGKKFPLQECECRHKDGFLPSNKEKCMTGGTVDMNKAQAFVMSDFRQSLRQWLQSCQRNPHEVVTDLEDSEEEEIEVEEIGSQPISLSSYDPEHYPSSPLKKGDPDWKRKATKQRLTILSYLVFHSDTREAFNRAFKQLCQPDLYLVHLCGCGLNSETLRGACVTGSHLKLAPAELNRDHVHYHFVLSQISSKQAYIGALAALKGGSNGKFDDVF